MKREEKIRYVAPTINVVLVELEQGIAASSATLSGGSGATPYQPEVESWADGGFEAKNGDL